MARVTRHEMLMEVAEAVAKRGTCSRLQVGAVFAKDGRIVVTGYNGAPAGMPHCVHNARSEMIGYGLVDGKPILPLYVEPSGMVSEGGCQIAEHAERNAIAFAARHGLALEGTELFCTDAPCLACARSIINAGVKSVFFLRAYRLTEGVELLRAAGIRAFDMATNEG